MFENKQFKEGVIMLRDVEMIMKDKKMGIWVIECKECPLANALKTLNQKPRMCVSGIVTNVQGAVSIGDCEFLNRKVEPTGVGKNLKIDCTKVVE
jgi:hypothetical protein